MFRPSLFVDIENDLIGYLGSDLALFAVVIVHHTMSVASLHSLLYVLGRLVLHLIADLVSQRGTVRHHVVWCLLGLTHR